MGEIREGSNGEWVNRDQRHDGSYNQHWSVGQSWDRKIAGVNPDDDILIAQAKMNMYRQATGTPVTPGAISISPRAAKVLLAIFLIFGLLGGWTLSENSRRGMADEIASRGGDSLSYGDFSKYYGLLASEGARLKEGKNPYSGKLFAELAALHEQATTTASKHFGTRDSDRLYAEIQLMKLAALEINYSAKDLDELSKFQRPWEQQNLYVSKGEVFTYAETRLHLRLDKTQSAAEREAMKALWRDMVADLAVAKIKSGRDGWLGRGYLEYAASMGSKPAAENLAKYRSASGAWLRDTLVALLTLGSNMPRP